MMFIWWDFLLKIVPMCITFSNMLIHLLTMFAMFIRSMQVIKLKLSINQFRFNLTFIYSFVLLY
jgi:hypothetical protein